MTGTALAGALRERLESVRRTMLGLPYVTGVGFGWKEKRGQITDVAAWRIYVRKKVAGADLAPADTIPACCQGLLTDVVPACRGAAAVQVTGAPPLRPGITISNLRGVLQEQAAGPHHSGMGTLGFFALVNGIAGVKLCWSPTVMCCWRTAPDTAIQFMLPCFPGRVRPAWSAPMLSTPLPR